MKWSYHINVMAENSKLYNKQKGVAFEREPYVKTPLPVLSSLPNSWGLQKLLGS
jgi:hypothetical protein